MSFFKLQSAMEYLMTYSWAFLVIALVLVVFFALGLFNPGASVNTQCILPAGFACENLFVASNGLMNINLLQATQQPVNITALGCNTNNTVAHMYLPYNPNNPSNQINIAIGANYSFAVRCWSGTSAFSKNPGGVFSGFVFINYTDVVTGFAHTITGQVIAKVT